jgi:hypothetical protein
LAMPIFNIVSNKMPQFTLSYTLEKYNLK